MKTRNIVTEAARLPAIMRLSWESFSITPWKLLPKLSKYRRELDVRQGFFLLCVPPCEPEILAEIKNIPLAFKQAKHIFHFRISKQGPISANLENLFFIFEFFAFFIVFAIIKFIYPIIKFVIFHNETFSKSIPQHIQTYFNK